MTMDKPVIGWQAGARIIEAEVVIADADCAISRNCDAGNEGLAVTRHKVPGRLVHLDGRRPSEPTVRRHGEGDAGVLAVAEARVLPHDIEPAAGSIHDCGRVR